jgi:hypothetical protein
MNARASHVVSCALSLAVMLFATAVSAQSFFIRFAGTPSSIACTNTSFTLGPGVTYDWNLPSASTPVHIVGTANGTIIQDVSNPFGSASGSSPLTGGPPAFASTPFPFTVTYTLTPQVADATTSSFSFLCASATGTNFTFTNGAPFSILVPTLDRWGLLALTALLGAASLLVLRRPLGRG